MCRRVWMRRDVVGHHVDAVGALHEFVDADFVRSRGLVFDEDGTVFEDGLFHGRVGLAAVKPCFQVST